MIRFPLSKELFSVRLIVNRGCKDAVGAARADGGAAVPEGCAANFVNNLPGIPAFRTPGNGLKPLVPHVDDGGWIVQEITAAQRAHSSVVSGRCGGGYIERALCSNCGAATQTYKDLVLSVVSIDLTASAALPDFLDGKLKTCEMVCPTCKIEARTRSQRPS